VTRRAMGETSVKKDEQRKYSVAEIDEMRAAVAGMWSMPADETLKMRLVEERLRTYMLNGTEPSELEEAARLFREKWTREFWRQQENA
jgi:hypothetical protein